MAAFRSLLGTMAKAPTVSGIGIRLLLYAAQDIARTVPLYEICNDAPSSRVHQAVPAPRPAESLPPHPPLRAARGCLRSRDHRNGPRVAIRASPEPDDGAKWVTT